MKKIDFLKSDLIIYYLGKFFYNPFVAGLMLSLLLRLTVIEASPRATTFMVSITCFGLSIVIGIILSKNKKWLIFCLAFSIGFIAIQAYSPKNAWSGLPLKSITEYTGCVSSDSRKLSSGKFLFKLKLQTVKNKKAQIAKGGGEIIVITKQDPRLFIGNIITISSNLNIAEEYQTVMNNQRAGSYSYIKDDISFFSYPQKDDIIDIGWKYPILKKRAMLMQTISFRNNKIGSGGGGLFTALFAGNRDGLSKLESQVFRKSGCAHVLALSGMHLGILSGIILFLLKPLPGRKIGFLISCLIILIYLFLTGFGISLTRAALMYFIGGISYAFYRKFRPLDVLCLSFICLVIINPSSFYTLSFQLSFAAVAGILIVAPIFERLLRPIFPTWLAIGLSCSLAAQLFVFPFLIYYFGEVYQIGIFAGLIIAPMVTIFIWVGILHLIADFAFLSVIGGYLYKTIFFIAEKMSKFPSVGKSFSLGFSIILCCLVLLLLFCYSIYRSKVDGIPNKL